MNAELDSFTSKDKRLFILSQHLLHIPHSPILIRFRRRGHFLPFIRVGVGALFRRSGDPYHHRAPLAFPTLAPSVADLPDDVAAAALIKYCSREIYESLFPDTRGEAEITSE